MKKYNAVYVHCLSKDGKLHRRSKSRATWEELEQSTYCDASEGLCGDTFFRQLYRECKSEKVNFNTNFDNF